MLQVTLIGPVFLMLVACNAPQVSFKGSPMNLPAPVHGKQTLAPLDLSCADAGSYTRANAARLHQARATLAALEARADTKPVPPALDVLDQLDALAQQVDRATSHAGLMRNVHPAAPMREAADKAEQGWSQLVTEMGLSRPLYELVAALDPTGLDPLAARTLAHTLRDFRRSGVDKNEATRNQIRQLKEELVQQGQLFDQHIREDVRHVDLPAKALTGLPQDYKQAHPTGKDGQVRISTDYPDYIPFMSYAEDDAARKALYTAFRQRGFPSNEAVLRGILERRFRLAKALGFASWADYITEDKMIGSAQAAQTFIDKISELVVPRGRKDAEAMLTVLRQHDPNARHVGDWQKAYLEELERRSRYNLDSQKLREFFPFAQVRDGILATTAKMFGVRYQRVQADTWHKDVEAYELYQGKELLGRFFLDLHPRADKYKHAAAFPIQAGFVDGEVRQLPVAALVCNFPAGDEALMEHDDVTTFFHEFGHLLHHLFASGGKWIDQAGISTEWDFVEAPSQMLEEWSFDPQVLRLFAKTLQGTPIDDATIAALHSARNLGRGLWVQQQMYYAALSLAYHHQDPFGPLLQNTDLLAEQLQARYAPFPHVPGTHFQLSFGHLEGYSAMYYTYMWSLVIAKDLLGAFQAAPHLMSTDVAGQYRTKVLAAGGSKDAADLVADFLGRPFKFDAFAAWVNAAD